MYQENIISPVLMYYKVKLNCTNTEYKWNAAKMQMIVLSLNYKFFKTCKIFVLNKNIWYALRKVMNAKLTYKSTYAQKSSTVSNAVMSLRFAVHSLLRSFLKNQRAHLFCKGCLMSESGAIMAPSSVGSSSSSSTLSSYNSKDNIIHS